MNKTAIISLLMFSLGFLTACDKAKNNLESSVATSTPAEVVAAKPMVEDKAPSRTLTLAQPATRQWWHDAVVYQIWPRSFSDADGDGNGDFVGMTKKLPYLQSLGIKAVWLTPVFESPSYHGYDTTDFYSVERDYGTQAEFETFLQEAEAAGIKVIVDLVINHISSQHPWFVKSANKEPGYEDFFVWSKTMPANYGSAWFDVPDPARVWFYNETRKEYYYSVFGATQPDLNIKNPAVVAEIKKTAAFWLNKGVDGFRLDAVRYLIEEGGIPNQADTKSTLAFLADFNAYVKSQKPDAYLVGEALAANSLISKYFNAGKGIDAVFDFDFAMNVGSALEVRSMQMTPTDEEKTQEINYLREAFWRNLSERNSQVAPSYFFAAFTNNHDSDRLTLRMDNNQQRAKMAASILLTSPGTSPYLYYGEELAMSQAGLDKDMYRRGLMQWDDSSNAGFNTTNKRWMDDVIWFPWEQTFEPWWNFYWSNIDDKAQVNVAAQSADKNSMLSFYKKLINLRNKDITLRSPQTIKLYEETGNVWVAKYTHDNQSRWVILNLNVAKPSSFKTPPVLQGAFVNLVNDELLTVASDMQVGAGELLILSAE